MRKMEEKYEQFEISEGDWDQALNPMKRRRADKDEQVYGMWAGRDDQDSDDGDGQFSGFAGSNSSTSFSHASKKKDYAAPVSFVSGGFKQGLYKNFRKIQLIVLSIILIVGEKVSKGEADEREYDSDEQETTSITITGFKSGSRYQIKSEEQKRDKIFANASNAFAGLRTKTESFETELRADWEKFTKGIGSKLLQKVCLVATLVFSHLFRFRDKHVDLIPI